MNISLKIKSSFNVDHERYITITKKMPWLLSVANHIVSTIWKICASENLIIQHEQKHLFNNRSRFKYDGSFMSEQSIALFLFLFLRSTCHINYLFCVYMAGYY